MSNIKTIILLLFTLLTTTSQGQELRKIHLTPIIGYSIQSLHGNPYVRTSRKHFFITPAFWGLNIQFGQTPFSIYYIHSRSMEFANNWPNRALPLQNWDTRYILGRYRLNNGFSPEVGLFKMKYENVASFLFGKVVPIKGLVFGVSKEIDRINVGFKAKLPIWPELALTNLGQLNLDFSYAFQRKQNLDFKKIQVKKIQVHGIIGLRIFSTKNIERAANEDIHRLGTAIVYGIELFHTKSHFSIYQDSDFWLALNGGSLIRDVKGYISTTSYGIKYQHQLINNQIIRYGIGYSNIRSNHKLKATTPSHSAYWSSRKYNIIATGINISLAYQIHNKTNIELKNIFILKSRLNEKIFNPLRLSLGIIYRL